MTSQHDVMVAAIESLRDQHQKDPSPADVVHLLQENQVPLLSLVEPNANDQLPAMEGKTGSASSKLVVDVLNSVDFVTAVASETGVYQEVQGNFAELASRWAQGGVVSICFKSAGIPPAFPYTSENYDILVRPQDEDAARDVLMELGYVELTNTEEPQKWLFRLFVGGRSVCAIHLHTRVGWSQGFMLDDQIFRRRRQSTNDQWTWVPGPEDAILINVAHALYENKAFSLHDIMKVRQAVRDGVDWEYMGHVARERGWLKGLHFGLAMIGRLERRLFIEPMIPEAELRRFDATVRNPRRLAAQLERAETEPPVLPFLTSFVLVKLLFYDKIPRDRQETPLGRLRVGFLSSVRGAKTVAHVNSQNSALFALSGVDGSGKTAQAEDLLKACRACALRTQITWGRLGATPVMHRLSRLWRRRSIGRETSEPGNSSVRSRSGSGMKAWALLSTLDFAVWLLRIRWRMIRGDVIIADRYMADFDVELSLKLATHGMFREVLLKLLDCIGPRPTKAFLLDVSPDVALRRAAPDSGDFDPAAAIQRYREKSASYDLHTVDAEKPREDVAAQIAREGLRTYMERYATLSNFVFLSNPWQLNRPKRGVADGGIPSSTPSPSAAE